jgi:ammonium transporter, Amt family
MNETLSIAQEALQAANEAKFVANNIWMMVATVLVFIMHLGFATLESGFVQKKNVVNILFKNVMIVSIGLLSYYVIGFNLMYPGVEGGFLHFAGFGLTNPEGAAGLIDYAGGGYSYYTDFIFQGMFAATCCTIVSGAVAERVKLVPFLIFCLLFVTISYPITGYWKWGAGWLDAKGFYDFAGSTIVHSVGGWGALAGAILLGPRLGKYTSKGIKPIPGHSMPLATIGVFLLWFGWFGFNGGSVLSADPGLVSLVFVTTSIAAAAGCIGAFVMSKIMFGSYDLSMALNGILGGLVGITASADGVSVPSALIIGFIAGIIIPLSVTAFDKMKIDDPVGATSVHLVCGIWGTIAVALFGNYDEGVGTLGVQLLGIAAIGVFTFAFAFLVFFILKVTVGIRVDEDEEVKGLDLGEHQTIAYT